jgi:hypothetical protein
MLDWSDMSTRAELFLHLQNETKKEKPLCRNNRERREQTAVRNLSVLKESVEVAT